MVFRSETVDPEAAVLAAVEAWRGQLPRTALGGHLEHMELAARKAAEAGEGRLLGFRGRQATQIVSYG